MSVLPILKRRARNHHDPGLTPTPILPASVALLGAFGEAYTTSPPSSGRPRAVRLPVHRCVLHTTSRCSLAYAPMGPVVPVMLGPVSGLSIPSSPLSRRCPLEDTRFPGGV